MKRIFALFVCLLLPVHVSASVYVVHDIEESAARSLVFQLSELLPSKTQVIPIRNVFLEENVTHIKDDDVIVAVGVDSFLEACSLSSEGSVIAAFIGEEEYRQAQSSCSIPSSAIFSGAPLETRLALLNNIWFDKKPLAVVFSDGVAVDEGVMSEKAARYGFNLSFFKTSEDRLSMMKTIGEVIVTSNLIVSLVDTKLYGDRDTQNILKLLFKNDKVIIGPSFPTTNSGALFAVYSTSDAKLKALSERIQSWSEYAYLLPAKYPDSLRVKFNAFLVRAHGVVLPSPAYLKSTFGLCSETNC